MMRLQRQRPVGKNKQAVATIQKLLTTVAITSKINSREKRESNVVQKDAAFWIQVYSSTASERRTNKCIIHNINGTRTSSCLLLLLPLSY